MGIEILIILKMSFVFGFIYVISFGEDEIPAKN